MRYHEPIFTLATPTHLCDGVACLYMMNPLPVSTSVHYIYSGLHCNTVFKFHVVFLPFNLTDRNIVIASYWHMFKRGREGCKQSGSWSLFNKDHLMNNGNVKSEHNILRQPLGRERAHSPMGGTHLLSWLWSRFKKQSVCYLALLNVNLDFKNIFIEVKMNVLQRGNIDVCWLYPKYHRMNWGTYRLPNIIYILRQTHGTLNLSGHRKHFATALRVKCVINIYKK